MQPRSALPAGVYDRMAGLLSPATWNAHVVIVGVGAGSYFVEKLARLGPRHIDIADNDVVEIANLTRTSYEFGDVGRPKVEALTARLARVAPWVEVKDHEVDLLELTDEEVFKLIGDADLVVHGTDSFDVAARINKLAWEACVPVIYIGIHEQARGGRVQWTIPPATACYRCLAPERYEAHARGGRDATDLDGAAGLLPDIQFIDMVALKVALAILERGQDSVMGRFFERMAGRNDIVVRCSPEYSWGNSLWDAVLGDIPKEPRDYAREIKEQALFAMDAIWLKAERDPACPDCGPCALRPPV